MKTKKITVLKKDITWGEQGNTFTCPIARAFKRSKFRFVNVDTNSILFGKNKETEFLVDTPKRVKKFITRFDDGEEVKPFSFVVKLKTFE